MALQIKHFDSPDSTEPIEWSMKDSATLKMAEDNKAQYPGATKLFDTDVDDTQPVLVFHKDKHGQALPPRPKLEDLEKSKHGSLLRTAVGDLFLTARIAKHVIKQARRMLPGGALNAAYMLDETQVPQSGPPDYSDPDHAIGLVCGNVAPALLYEKQSHLKTMATIKDDCFLPPFDQLLAEFYATMHIQAGVCDMISSVVAAVTSMSVTPEVFNTDKYTSLLRVSHEDGHSFCLLSYGRSPWIVMDPWCGEPYACAIEENRFDEDGIQAYTQIDFYKRFETPFGIPLLEKWDADHLDSQPVEGLGLTAKLLKAATTDADGIQSGSADENDMLVPGQTVMKWDDKYGWVKNALARYRTPFGERSFHLLQDVWCEQSNHQKISDSAAYAEHFKRTRPVLLGHQWGDNVPTTVR